MSARILDAREELTHPTQSESATTPATDVAARPQFLQKLIQGVAFGRTARRLAHWTFVSAAVWAMIVPAPALFAASQTWTGNALDGKWSTPGNWTNNAAPGSTSVKTSTDIATFQGGGEASGQTNITIDSTTQNIGGITWNTASAFADTIGSLGPNGGNDLFFTAAPLTSGNTIATQLTSTVANAETINAPMVLEGNYFFSDLSTNAAAILNLNGNISLDAGVGNSTLFLGTTSATGTGLNNGAGKITISGVVSNGAAGTLGLTGGGTGAATDILTLSGANTYTGANTLNAGIVNLGIAENVGVSGPLGKSAATNPGNIVLNGSILQYTAANQFDYSGRFSTNATVSPKYNIDINGQNVNFNTSLKNTGTGGAGVLTLTSTSGGGTLSLGAANTFATGAATVGVFINGGTLQINNDGALNFNQVTNTGTKVNVQFASTGGVLELNGHNTTIENLDPTNNTASTASVVENGGASDAVLTVTSDTFNGTIGQDNFYGTLIDGSGGGTLGLTKNGATNLVLRNAGDTFSGPTVVNGGLLLYLVAGSQGNLSSLTVNVGGSVSAFTSAVTGVGPVIPLQTLANATTSGSDGSLVLSFQNPDSETLTLGGPVFLGAGSGNFSTFNGTINAVQNTLAGSAETYPNYHFGSGGVGQLTINSSGFGALLTDNGAQKQGVIVQGILKSLSNGSSPTLSNWNTLANAGAGGSGGGAATITQGGTIELQGQNTYSGDTLVNVNSTLFPNAANPTLSTEAILQVNNGSITSGGNLVSGPIGTGTLHISQGGLQDGGLPVVLNNHVILDGNAIFASQGNGTITFNSVGLANPVTFDISNNPSLIVKNISTTISDTITGTSNLTKSGIGNLILDGANTFTGNITINPATTTITAGNGNAQTIFGLGLGGTQFNSAAAIGNAANMITVNGGAFAASGPNYTNLQSTFFNRIVNTSSGTIALTASTADNFDWSSATGVNFTLASLGAAPARTSPTPAASPPTVASIGWAAVAARSPSPAQSAD